MQFFRAPLHDLKSAQEFHGHCNIPEADFGIFASFVDEAISVFTKTTIKLPAISYARTAVPLSDLKTRAEDKTAKLVRSFSSAGILGFIRLIPFILTGVANSIVGYSVIFLCLFVGTSGITANVTGFGIGLACSFLLNRRYVFGMTGSVSHVEVIRFLTVFVAAYGTNMSVLLLLQPVLGEGSPVAQMLAVAAYTLVFYPLSRMLVFRPAALAD